MKLKISSVFVVSLLCILKDSGNISCCFCLEIISFIVSMFLMSRFIFSEDGRKLILFGCTYASLVCYVFKFIHIISYSRELGFVSFILLYKLSRNVMDFSRPIVPSQYSYVITFNCTSYWNLLSTYIIKPPFLLLLFP